jgi:hypothetical protein
VHRARPGTRRRRFVRRVLGRGGIDDLLDVRRPKLGELRAPDRLKDVPLEQVSVPLSGSRSNTGCDAFPRGRFSFRPPTRPGANGWTALTSGRAADIGEAGPADDILAGPFPAAKLASPHLEVSYRGSTG